MTFKMTNEDCTVTVYNLLADTREFIGKEDAFIPAFTGLPANCTMVKPPETEKGVIAVFDEEKQEWLIKEDHRGEVVFSTQTGTSISITEIGSYPPETTIIAPENIWQKWNGKAWVTDKDAERAALVVEAEAYKKSVLTQANAAIATLQDAVDLDMATDQEKLRLVEFKKIRILLSRISSEDAPDIVWPEAPGNVA